MRLTVTSRIPLLFVLFLSVFPASPMYGQSAPPSCKTKFTVVRKDELNNFQQGLLGDDLKWMEKTSAKKYPGVCYVSPVYTPSLVFYITVDTSTYHGTRTETESHSEPVNATVTDQQGNTSTVSGNTEVTTKQTVPYSFDYPLFTLSIETQNTDGTFSVLHNFRRKGICPTLAGFCVKNRHPHREIIEEAMKWIQAGGLTDPLQSVLGQEKK